MYCLWYQKHINLKQQNEPQRQKAYFGHVRPAKIQISLRIRAVWSESSLGAFWIAKDAKCLRADNEDSDQTRRLILVFVGHTCPNVRFRTLRIISYIAST